jgi:LacI family transcriptional regulator
MPAALVPRQSTDVFAVDDPLVARALRFLAENSNRMVAVSEVAAEVAVSRRKLERRFRAAVGRSIAEESIRLRVNRAKRRLVESDEAIKEVALASGFRSANHFGKVFARAVGISPVRFREARENPCRRS